MLQVGGDLFVATDVGVFTSRNLGASWLKVGTGMPNAPITSLDYQTATKTLLAGNFGRGAYSLVLPPAGAAAAPKPAEAQLPRTGLPVPAPVADGAAAPVPVSVAEPADVAAAEVAAETPLQLPVAALVALLLLAGVAGGGLLALRRR